MVSSRSFGTRPCVRRPCAGDPDRLALIGESVMDEATMRTWMTEIANSIRAERDYLVQLDAAIGDGDHGINMTRGFEAVVQALGADNGSPPGRLLIIAGRTLVSTVGGASGPLWGSALRSGGGGVGGQNPFHGPRRVPRARPRQRPWAGRRAATRRWSRRSSRRSNPSAQRSRRVRR